MEILVMLVIGLFVVPKGAHAYLDPGTGSYVIQVVIASAAAGTYFFKDKLGSGVSAIKKILSGSSSKKHGRKK